MYYNRKLSGCLAMTVAAVLAAACDSAEPEARDPLVRPVKLITIGEATAGGTFEYPGSVSAAQESEMAFQVAGQIIAMPVAEGQFVEQGSVLAELDPRDYAAQRDKASAERNAAKAEYDRYTKAFEAQAVTAQDVDLKKRNYEVAEADLRRAQKALDDTKLRAPFSGKVAVKLVDDFATVQVKQPVLLLQDESSLQIKVNIPEADWAKAEPGLTNEQMTDRFKPQVELAAIPNRRFIAQIEEKTSSADPVTRTYEVTLGFDRPEDLNISPGMTGKIVITVPERIWTSEFGETLIPASAVMADADNNPYVWVVPPDSNSVIRKSIEVGKLDGSEVRVLDGLAPGDQVVISGVNSLSEGMLVRQLEST
jgi:RND family efflux transporter MFP subunit